ncbi:DUF1343 domain-containing protein [Porphyromonadaceae bacterium W3.11]|nr:DUF1343 domain-containing protein [Porphyromonadaceae bacterium W3.11]
MKNYLLGLGLIISLTFFTISYSYAQVEVAADQLSEILKYTKGKRVGITLNHTSVLSDSLQTHLLDHLMAHKVDVRKLYTPEHGLRGTSDAGKSIASGRDQKSGLPIISLYGNHRKPTARDLSGIDVMLFDLQDVGVRFYTYISTLYYVLEACAEEGVPVIVLDRPNPHDTIDGFVLKDKKYRSFVSLLPIPTVHGLTLGEAAEMINGEGWLARGLKAELTVITVKGWRHGDPYSLVVSPSPNLRSDRAILLYPTICYFEASSWSEGRGTKMPFEQIGYPDKRMGTNRFVPRSQEGATHPKHKGRACYGPDLNNYDVKLGINLDIILDAARVSRKYGVVFIKRSAFFNLLAGNSDFLSQVNSGMSAEQIRATWQPGLEEYKKLRRKYLLYPDYREDDVIVSD